MPVETELKLILADRAGLEAALRAAGAAPDPAIEEDNRFFDTAEGRLRAADEGLRLRIHHGPEGAHATLTHKGARHDTQAGIKAREENETAVSDPEAMERILAASGLARVRRFAKHRTRWHLRGCHVELDELPGIGSYVELEGPDGERVQALRKELGLGQAPTEDRTYAELVAQANAGAA